jgi:hypothetical protein
MSANDRMILTGGGSFSVGTRADAAILVAERERVATE